MSRGQVDTTEARKARGAFFTPPAITEFIAEWAIRAGSDRVLEPSCGDAEFLIAASERLRDIGAGLFLDSQVQGVELHGPSAEEARRRLEAVGVAAGIRVSDFFDVEPDPFDVVVGNPPYVRYQDFAGTSRTKALEAALQQGVRLSGLSSSWAAFVVHASRFVAPSGRMGLVLPAELLTVKYAASVRRFLLERFGRIRLVMFEELVFPNVQEEVVLLLAEGYGPVPSFEVFQARNLDDLREIDADGWTEFSPATDDKWLRALLAPDELDAYRELLEGNDFELLRDWGRTYLGIVTGNNRFFALTKEDVRKLGLTDKDLLRISPPGSRHLRGLSFKESAWQELADEGRKVFLFYPDQEQPSTAARRYIADGEDRGVHKGYKCRNRSPWWRVPLVDQGDLFLTYMDRDRPRLVTKRVQCHHLNSLYGVSLREGRKRTGMDLLPLAALNTVTMLGAELVGRSYGGGMLKLEPRDADRLPVPALELIEQKANDLRAIRPQVAAELRKGDLDRARKLVDRVVLTEGVGMTFESLRALRRARNLLFDRRSARSGRSNSQCQLTI